jgi:uncharacterized membrane protein
MNDSSNQEKTSRPAGWVGEIVYLRGLAIIWVVTLHALYTIWILDSMTWGQFPVAYMSLLFRGIPVFIFASGLALSVRSKSAGRTDPLSFYKKRLLATVSTRGRRKGNSRYNCRMFTMNHIW